MNTILIVDDESRYSRIARVFLTFEGFYVISAANASLANEILKNQPVDLVLLDLKLSPVNGKVLFDVMQLFHRKVKVIIASVLPLDQQRRLVPEAQDYFDKADGLKTLLQKIRAALPEKCLV